jgi:hypothetical protein
MQGHTVDVILIVGVELSRVEDESSSLLVLVSEDDFEMEGLLI